jgi:hypothetical protein
MPIPFWKRRSTARSMKGVRVAAFLLIAAWSVAACSTALGLSDYVFRPSESEGGALDAQASSDGPVGSTAHGDGATGRAEAAVGAASDASEDGTSCDVNLASQCYPCAPQLNAQFLNACTSSACVPFDDRTRVTHLLPDGALPPLPASDSGSDAAAE